MKKCIYYTGVTLVLSLGVYLYSCSKEETKLNREELTTSDEFPVPVKMKGSEYTVICNGVCNGGGNVKCGLQGQIGSNGQHRVYCDCTGCAMTVTKHENGISTTYTDEDGVWEVSYLRAFNEYMSNNHVSYSIVKYKIQSSENYNAETYSYKTESGKIKTVLVVGDRSGMKPDITVYDCDGSCGCTEIFNLGTETASCSCQPCAMRVEHIKK